MGTITCLVCGCTDDSEYAAALHAALDRDLNKPTDGERRAPLVELVTDHQADLYIRARRAGA